MASTRTRGQKTKKAANTTPKRKKTTQNTSARSKSKTGRTTTSRVSASRRGLTTRGAKSDTVSTGITTGNLASDEKDTRFSSLEDRTI